MADIPHLRWVTCHQEGMYDCPLWSLRMSYHRVINHSERGSPGVVRASGNPESQAPHLSRMGI